MKFPTDKKKAEKPIKFIGRFRTDGGLEFNSFTKIHLKKFIMENPNMPFELKPMFPESSRQRAFFEGAICPLITFYQENMDHRDSNDIRKIREWLKIEFNGEIITVGSKTHKVAQSTSQRLNLGFLERVIDWLIENYVPPMEALDPNAYKLWKDTIFPYGGPENYIDYLLELKLIKRI